MFAAAVTARGPELPSYATQLDALVAAGGSLAWTTVPGRNGKPELATRICRGGQIEASEWPPQLDFLATVHGNYQPKLTGPNNGVLAPGSWAHEMLFSPAALGSAGFNELVRHLTTGLAEAAGKHTCLYDKKTNPGYHAAIAKEKTAPGAFAAFWKTQDEFGQGPPVPLRKPADGDPTQLRTKLKLVGRKFATKKNGAAASPAEEAGRAAYLATLPDEMQAYFEENADEKQPRILPVVDAVVGGVNTPLVPPGDLPAYHNDTLGRGSVVWITAKLQFMINPYQDDKPFFRLEPVGLTTLASVAPSGGGSSGPAVDWAAFLANSGVAQPASVGTSVQVQSVAVEAEPEPEPEGSEPEPLSKAESPKKKRKRKGQEGTSKRGRADP